MGTAIKHPVSDRVKPSFVIFDTRHSDAYPWASQCPDFKNYKWRLNEGLKCTSRPGSTRRYGLNTGASCRPSYCVAYYRDCLPSVGCRTDRRYDRQTRQTNGRFHGHRTPVPDQFLKPDFTL